MKSYSSREVMKKLVDDGWFLYQVRGDHYQYKHTTKKGKVTLTHPKKDIPLGTIKNIEKQSGIIFD